MATISPLYTAVVRLDDANASDPFMDNIDIRPELFTTLMHYNTYYDVII